MKWYNPFDVASGAVWDDTALHGAKLLAVRRPDGVYVVQPEIEAEMRDLEVSGEPPES